MAHGPHLSPDTLSLHKSPSIVALKDFVKLRLKTSAIKRMDKKHRQKNIFRLTSLFIHISTPTCIYTHMHTHTRCIFKKLCIN